MTCSGCGNKEAHHVSFALDGQCKCNACGSSSGSFKFSDVFFKEPYFDPHIAHPEHSPRGTHIRSREHKAIMMKGLGLSEKGDKVRGARDQY